MSTYNLVLAAECTELMKFTDVIDFPVGGFKLGMCSLKMVLSRRNKLA
jgi:hypothetical protein